MAAIGLKMLYVGLKNDDGTVITGTDGLNESGVYEIDTNKSHGNLGTKTANITGLSGTLTKITGNNQVVDVTKPDAAPSVAVDANAINHEVKEKLLGKKKENGGWVDQSKPAESALIVESQTPIDLKSVYFAFGRGHFSEASQNVQTNTDTNQTREDDNLTFTALGYDQFDGKADKTYYASDDDFDRKKMFDEVFPGNTYTNGMSDSTAGGSGSTADHSGSNPAGTSTPVSTPAGK